MRNPELARDHIRRSRVRLRALDVLFEGESWADVVRESQEVVELSLKALLRACGIDAPRVHDLSDVLLAERERLPAEILVELDALVGASRQLRRDRELAFYGAEDLTPSGFSTREDAEGARTSAQLVVDTVEPHVLAGYEPAASRGPKSTRNCLHDPGTYAASPLKSEPGSGARLLEEERGEG
jgi:HEPN domain-containing protein